MGPLRGMWKVESIETPNDADPDGPDIEMEIKGALYYSFDMWVLQLTDNTDTMAFGGQYGTSRNPLVARVSGEDPTYTLTFPNAAGKKEMDMLKRWGVDESPVSMQIISISGSRMTAKVGRNTLTFKKW